MDADVSCIKADISEVKVILNALLARVESQLAAWPTAGIASTRSPGLFCGRDPEEKTPLTDTSRIPRGGMAEPRGEASNGWGGPTATKC